ncbi:EbhA [Paenibacillus dakarensis]|uniref:EbhA n=1 Tax=Paenibacillus dakarensis TaxID=1527293 RepID=UPI000A65FD58|nr:EbhA [Paenibacillus dakarensis]
MKRSLTLVSLILIMCLGLTGCKSSDYNKAIKFEESKDYSSAAAIYEDLGDYKDSADRLKNCNTLISAIEKYDAAKKDVEKKNTELETTISTAEALISKGEKALNEKLIPTLETAISETKSVKYNIPARPDAADDIVKVTEELNNIDYSAAQKNLTKKTNALEHSIKQYALVNAPTEAYVIQRLKKVKNVADISAVTEENDPNGQLHKPGGYTSQVYFSSNLVNQSEVYGTTIIDKGTDAGGSIEVYATAEEANKRKDYLASFDGGLFASGSHTVVGTVLVRTSNELTASQQKKLEADIIAALTSIED